ncbi:uncharacterized protein LOC107643155 isoform X1 [Arachis ipaensis]|uniref:uncharacterized protein LOC107643155 isoform X1 n=1 Tax=Arachis ipaensis TaxID=130454 RepID=UPI0007AEFEFE|nr:uncharacterized protein LOC107643155 isoform X1 [Arachis ipaensis]XP_016202226.1 uncharacterized protein LOC107643155 isoform X1 [Arachis ipaensis]XP_025630863.1 uncharacterized protein LOC112723644 isoform X1 [Arachis hypogaea]XP_025630864.1 uncharacterized protein LOC112723644 isoform X1 [Arachis hypogaea]
MAEAVGQKKVIIPNKHGNKLVGILHDSGTPEIVILCHGLQASKDHAIMVNLAAALQNAGISAFRFDFTGNGYMNSLLSFLFVHLYTKLVKYTVLSLSLLHFDFFPYRESEGSFDFANYLGEIEDIHSVIQHFHKENRTVSAIIGHSKGANEVLLYASKYHDIKTVVNLSGRYAMNGGLEERFGKDFMEKISKEGFIELKSKSGTVDFRLTEESLKERLNINMHEQCQKIDKDCRVLTVHGSADEIIPVGDAFEFAKILPNHKLHIIEGANHVYTDNQAELASVVVNFIKENKSAAS